MCTAVSLVTGGHYFGRTLDLEYHYRESVTVTPRNYPFAFRNGDIVSSHHAIIGVATVEGGYPLYYDAANEKGLCMAGLNFPGYARYFPKQPDTVNVTPFELIPWVLSRCGSVDEACALLGKVNILDEAFAPQWPLTPMHWMIADGQRCVVAEPVESGLVLHENPVGVLTNSPPFEHQLLHLSDYTQLSACPPENCFPLPPGIPACSRGMGAIGLPGDLSSRSRFVRAAFTRLNSQCGSSEEESVSQFFHILGSVTQTRGCVRLDGGSVVTVYSSCFSADRGIYYFTTYEDSTVRGVDMRREALDGCVPVSYPLAYGGQPEIIN